MISSLWFQYIWLFVRARPNYTCLIMQSSDMETFYSRIYFDIESCCSMFWCFLRKIIQFEKAVRSKKFCLQNNVDSVYSNKLCGVRKNWQVKRKAMVVQIRTAIRQKHVIDWAGSENLPSKKLRSTFSWIRSRTSTQITWMSTTHAANAAGIRPITCMSYHSQPDHQHQHQYLFIIYLIIKNVSETQSCNNMSIFYCSVNCPYHFSVS